MAKSQSQCLRIAILAIVVSIACGSTSVAQKIDWQADALASPFPKKATEPELIEQLKTSSPQGKAIACKQLAIYGSKACVPEVAKLLADPQLSSWARITLEAIPDPSCDAALVEATKTLKGELLVGTINSIGVRRFAEACDQLASKLKDSDKEVACAAAVALGKIGNDKATVTLQQSLAGGDAKVRSAVAEGCVLCAERLIADGNSAKAAELYSSIRTADVPDQRVIEAIRGEIVARGDAGIPLLVEQLKSQNKKHFQVALATARQLEGQMIVAALSNEMAKASPERAALIVVALGEGRSATLPAAVREAARKGDPQVRLAAIKVVGRLGDESVIPMLLDIANDPNAELSQGGKNAIATMGGEKIDAELHKRLADANGKQLMTLIELAGMRRLDAAQELVKALDNPDKTIHDAALKSLGATVGPKNLKVLVKLVTNAKSDADRENAAKALHEASIRMPDREATAAELSAAMAKASTAAKVNILKTLGAMGGANSLNTIAASVKNGDEQLQDEGTRVLGEWMSADAGPVLLTIAKDNDLDRKYRVRALRGYLRIARQLDIPDADRIAMCKSALAVAERPDERKLALDALKRCPSTESIELASSLLDDKEIGGSAVEVAIFIGEKIKDKNPAAAKTAAEKALKTEPTGAIADRARALAKP